mmetsp:Transcript_3550/g.7107  ORF Transcript_3550/g.7107 Transcript_3550/m.7107 type:complete len:616 (-) Transcript_3550:517-2364(-)
MDVESMAKGVSEREPAGMEVDTQAFSHSQVEGEENEEQKNDAVLVSVLIDDLQNDDVQFRLNSMRKLGTIAKALGPDRTIKELVPYLSEFVDDEDDILVVLSDQLGGLHEFVGGAHQAHVLLVPLETLSGIEESVVREKAVESIKKIMKVLNKEQLREHAVPLVRRLGTGKWFTSRVSSSSLFELLYPHLEQKSQDEMRALFTRLCEDETPMVRRAACQQLGNFASVVDYKHVVSELLPSMAKLTQDAQDSVRLRTVENCVLIAKCLNDQDRQSKILPMIYALCKDKSWRVRYMVADKFCDLTKAAGKEGKNRAEMVNIFVQLLQDGEAEVRTAAAQKIADVAGLIGKELTTEKLMKPTEALAKDDCQYTRAALASVIMALANCASKEVALEFLLPQFLQLLKDDDPEVRLNVISKLDTVNDVIGIQLLSQSLLPAIDELARDKKWRIRLAILKHIPILATKLGPDLFKQKLCGQCMEWLRDSVYQIRIAAAENLKNVAKSFDSKWVSANFIPEVKRLADSKKPSHRMSAIYAIKYLSEVVEQKLCKDELLPLAVNLSRDKVANLRFTVAKTFQTMSGFIDQSVAANEIRSCLESLAQDPDQDVVYFAKEALECM